MGDNPTKADPPGWEEPVAAPRLVAALIAGWLIPGAGHAVLGRFARAAIMAAIVLGSFTVGCAHVARFALIDPTEGVRLGPRGLPGIYISLSSLQALANVGVGPIDAIMRRNIYGEVVYVLPVISSEERERLLHIVRERISHESSNYGTAYVWTAGLMNLLLLLDVWDIGRGRKP